jgi:hypothetical protein
MEELFSLMTVETYPCNSDSISETKKQCTGTNYFWRLTVMKQIHLTRSLHCRNEAASRNISDGHFVTIFCFNLGICKLF